jgi:hypothetical protein
MSPV